MYLASLVHSLLRSDVGILHRLLTKGFGRNAIIKWCMAITGSKFQIFKATFLKCLMKVHNDSFFSYWMLMRATKIRW